MTFEEVMNAARNAHAAGDTQAAHRLVNMAREMSQPTQPVATAEDRRARYEQMQAAARPVDTSAIDQIAEDQMTLSGVGRAGGAMAKAVQGLPFAGEWIDEGFDKINPGQGERLRNIQEAMDRQHPGLATTAQLGGAVLGSVPLAVGAAPAITSAKGLSMAGKTLTGIGAGIGVGATEGSIQGAGANEEDRAQGARSGALLGGGMGLVGGALGPLAGKTASKTADFLADKFARTKRFIPGLSREASEQIMMAGKADDAAGAGLLNMVRAGGARMPADLGQASTDLLDLATNTSADGVALVRPRVGARASAANDTLTEAFDSALGGPKAIKGLVKANSDAARTGLKEAYSEAYDTAIDYSSKVGEELLDLFDEVNSDKLYRRGIEQANRLIKREKLPRQYLIQIGEDGKAVLGEELPNTVQLDYIKRGLQQVVNDSVDPITGKMSSDGRLAQQLAREIRQKLGEANPAYEKAVQAASDSLSLENALTFGRKALGKGVEREDVAEFVAGATKVERKNFAQGVRSYIDDVMANTQAAITNSDIDAAEVRKVYRTLSSRASRDKITAVLGEQEAAKIFRALEEAERSFALKAGTAANSRTAGRLQANQVLTDALAYRPGQMAKDAVSSPLGGVRRAAEMAVGNTPIDKANVREGVMREVADFMTGTQGPDADAQVGLLIDALRKAPLQAQSSAAIGNVAGTAPGLLGHQLVTQGQRRQASRQGR